MSRTSSARWTRLKPVTPHHESLFFEHDAPVLEHILNGWKLIGELNASAFFAIPLY